MDDMLHSTIRNCSLLIPAAGDSKRFSDVGIHKPKGLIRSVWTIDKLGETREGTMIQHVVPLNWIGKIRVACKLEYKDVFTEALPKDWDIFPIISSRGQADTVWQACQDLPGDILIINSDNGFSHDLCQFVNQCRVNKASCGAVVFTSKNNRYGFINNFPLFEFGVEKIPISKYALAGAFYFKSARTIMDASIITLNDLMLRNAEIYLSDLFLSIDGLKMGYLIPQDELFEWGAPAQMLKDKSLKIYDEDVI